MREITKTPTKNFVHLAQGEQDFFYLVHFEQDFSFLMSGRFRFKYCSPRKFE
jgi:hypothetical protein